MQGSAGEQARLATMLAAIDPDAAADLVGSAMSEDVNAVDVKEAEELEIATILSKGTSVLLGPYVRYLAPCCAASHVTGPLVWHQCMHVCSFVHPSL